MIMTALKSPRVEPPEKPVEEPQPLIDTSKMPASAQHWS